MTDNSDKIRSIVLAALMVFSVFAGTVAFAGTAAAANSATNVTVSDVPADGEVAERSTVTHSDVDFTLTDLNDGTSGETVNVKVYFTNGPEITDSSGVTSNISSSSGTVQNGNLTFTLDPSSSSKDATVEISDLVVDYPSVNSNTSSELRVSVDDTGGTNIDTSLASLTIVDTSTSGESATITNGSVIYQGQMVEGIGFNDNEDVNLYQGEPGDSTFQNTYTADADGVVTFPTDSLETGQDYFVRGEDSDENASFEVVEHQFSATLEDAEIGNAGGSATTAVEFDSNRRTFDVYVSAEDLDADEVQDMVDDDLSTSLVDLDGDGTNDSVATSIDRNTEYTVNGTGIDAGSYTLDFDVADTTASTSTDLNVSDVGAGEAEFTEGSFTIEQGNVAEINISLDGAAEGTGGTLVIGNEESEGYQANVSFEDGNADGQVVIEFNTYAAGNATNGTVVEAAAEDDSVTFDANANQTSINNILAQGDYTLSVSTADDAGTTLDQPQDLGALAIGPRSTDSMQLWTAPGNADLNADGENGVTAGDLATLIEDGAVTQDDTITAGDYVVHQITATGLEGLVEANGGLADTLLNDGGLSVSIVQTNPVQNQDAKEVNISASTSALTLVEGDDAYYIVADSGSLTLEDDSKSIVAGDEFEATFTVADDRLLRSDDPEDHQSVNATFTVEAPATELDSDPVNVTAETGQMVSGSTNYAPGTELTVRVRSTSDVSPGFFNTDTVTVQPDGTFSAEFAFDEQSAGDTFDVTVRKGGSTVAEADGNVVESTSTPTATATATATEQPETETATATATATATEAPDTETEAMDTDTEQPDTETTTTTTPGFGVAVALVALLAAALLAGRRE